MGLLPLLLLNYCNGLRLQLPHMVQGLGGGHLHAKCHLPVATGVLHKISEQKVQFIATHPVHARIRLFCHCALIPNCLMEDDGRRKARPQPLFSVSFSTTPINIPWSRSTLMSSDAISKDLWIFACGLAKESRKKEKRERGKHRLSPKLSDSLSTRPQRTTPIRRKCCHEHKNILAVLWEVHTKVYTCLSGQDRVLRQRRTWFDWSNAPSQQQQSDWSGLRFY